MGDSLLTLRQVQERCQLGKSTVYRWVLQGSFPAPVKLGPKSIRWKSGDVDGWIAGLPAGGVDAVDAPLLPPPPPRPSRP